MADSLYVPDPVAQDTLVQPWDEAFRSQRDVGLLVPVNFHTVPLISLRAACFNNGLYEDASFQKCFSNLLAVGLRRFVVDTYWDAPRGEWSLCPAEIPPASAAGSSSPVPVPTFTASSSLSSTSAGVTATISLPGFPKRQDASSASTSSSGSSSVGSSTSSTSATSSPPVAAPEQAGEVIFQLGSYNCTSTITLNYLTGIFNDFLEATSTTTDASFTYLLLNIHAAASWEHPNEPAQQPPADQLPAAGRLLSDAMKGNFSEELYTPSRLADDRANLGKTWDRVDKENMPRKGYYTVNDYANTKPLSTDDGWPTEAYVQFHQYFRLLAIFGTVDPQMSGYNRTLDADTIFPTDTLSFRPDVSSSSPGDPPSGCLFNASASTLTAETNSSFALALVPSTLSVPTNPNLTSPLPAIANLTACGLSPFLNHSLSPANTTAATNPLPYAALTHSYLWTWAPGEPLNATDPTAPGATGNRCAAASTTGTHPGRWHVVDCTTRLRVACQDPSAPYAWSLSPREATYDTAASACSAPAKFSVPHTPLENAHLLAAALATNQNPNPNPNTNTNTNTNTTASSVLLNLNSVDVADCWVASPNGTCPYRAPSDTDQTRIVVVPTVAAVLIFVCAALTFFVKCASNRREDKRGRRRTTVGGWEYEGVPS
ncbi:hypothetical protein P171DRAFT_403978 [Karstenula rhodostoma CBS 690.94]|uniref:Maintenance of telomere capping protein 6 n=1 Tax=Karstenula rhodostoma CBS 690.94 TaxID=1392251 RepID=A0A9P4PVL8_9PLEO|nr:hypothetical protein P171DRAFT_403978 [Karstenula rhodostoma CBS 690.94]